jgi:hypothetical protein
LIPGHANPGHPREGDRWFSKEKLRCCFKKKGYWMEADKSNNCSLRVGEAEDIQGLKLLSPSPK